jgi:hypothetical protein
MDSARWRSLSESLKFGIYSARWHSLSESMNLNMDKLFHDIIIFFYFYIQSTKEIFERTIELYFKVFYYSGVKLCQRAMLT